MTEPTDNIRLRPDGGVVLTCTAPNCAWLKIFNNDRKASPLERAEQSLTDHLERAHPEIRKKRTVQSH